MGRQTEIAAISTVIAATVVDVKAASMIGDAWR
jgi:hypothetical protein